VKRVRENKKAQATLFIIIGLIILLAIGIFYYIRTTVIEAQVDIALKQDTAKGDAVVVQNYVSSCLNDIAETGLLLLGQHGGYINLSRSDVHNQDFVIDEADATASDAASFGTLQIPYWWYEESSHGCTRCSITTKNIPTIEIMEEQITVYVEENLKTCLDAFTSLEVQGYTITEQGAPLIATAISEQAVYVQLEYPLAITKEGATSSLENWYVEIDVPLQEIYNAATEVVRMEIKNQFVEQMMLNIISAYAGVDENRLPPLAAFTEGYVIVYWVKENVKEQLGKYLKTYTPLIQIEGTTGAVPLEATNDYGAGFFKNLYRESTYPFGSLEVQFISPTTDASDYYLDITPRTGELLKPDTFKNEFFGNFLPPIQTNHYAFYYDISYPLVISVKEPTALQGEGYTFLFALEGNIRDNRNLMEWAQGTGTYGPWDPSKVTIGLKEGVPTTYPSGVDPETNETTYSTYEEPEKTLLCSATQRLSGDIKVGAYDGITGEPLYGASVAFKCGIYKTCQMGATDNTGAYEDSFPICVGGAVRIDADGYYTTYVDLDTTPSKEDSVIALLEPIKEVPVTIKYIPASRLNESLSTMALRNLAFDMSQYDNVLLTIEKVPDQLFEAPYSQIATITKKTPATVKLVSGTYSITALLMNDQGVIIPARNETIQGEEIEYPEVNMTMLGQSLIDETTGYWEVASEDLHSAEGVTFYVFRMNDPHYIEDLAILGQFGNYSTVYRDVIEPSWEK
jgi:hypothetical protein